MKYHIMFSNTRAKTIKFAIVGIILSTNLVESFVFRTENRRDIMLFAAVKQGNPVKVRTLILQGANPNACTSPPLFGCDAGTTPLLQLAVASSSVDVVRILLDGGSDVNALAEPSRSTALMHAAEQGRYDVACLLIHRRAKIDSRNYNGDNALTLSVLNNHIDIVKMLISNGADVNSTTDDGSNALSYARTNKYYAIIKVLKNAGSRDY